MKIQYLSSFSLVIFLTGCQTANYDANEKYDVTNAIQVAHDYLLDTRHFDSYVQHDGYSYRLKSIKSSKKNQSTLVDASSWQQVLINNATFINERSFEGLEENLSRTCWALKSDAEVINQYGAFRGVDGINTLSACISKRDGVDYPLFIYSWVEDTKVENYFMLLAPKEHPTNETYQCKLIQEGYVLSKKPICI